jgi:hypothetical protein
MKALLLFSSDFLRNRVQSLLDAQAIPSQHNQNFFLSHSQAPALSLGLLLHNNH